MTTAPAQPGSELLVTVCHYSSGPAKFAIQNHQQRATLSQLMADIQVGGMGVRSWGGVYWQYCERVSWLGVGSDSTNLA